jgi:hypothetical protein
MINDATCTREIKSRIATENAAFNREKTHLTSSKLQLNLSTKLVKYYIRSIVLYGAETWTHRKVDQKYVKIFKMWCGRRMEKVIWTDRLRNEEVLHRVKEKNILHTVKIRKANWIAHMLRRNCLLKYIIKEKIKGKLEVKERQERKGKQLLDGLTERTECWKLKEEALDRTL